jgi:hypothetical protein
VRLRAIPVATALAVVALCGWAVAHGWTTARFAAAKASAASQPERAAAVGPWVGVAGLAAPALDASLPEVADPTDTDAARRRGEALAALLAVRPLSSKNWLALAGMRLITGAPLDKVVEALTLSSVTGTNEGSLMLQRGTFGLLQWEALPAEPRKRTIADLAGALLGTPARDSEIAPTRYVLAAKAAETRREIADLLRVEGVSTRELTRMGL